MTDTPPVPPTPGTPATPPAGATPAAAPYAPAPGTPGPKQTLSLVGFIAGIAGFLFAWIPVLGFLVSLAGLIISLMAKGREPGAPKWMWIVGAIGGGVGILGSIVWTIVYVLPFIFAASYSSVS
jgi:hypothetical protein